jgi:hypothetical protein
VADVGQAAALDELVIPAASASSVTRMSFSASAEMAPTPAVKAASPW